MPISDTYVVQYLLQITRSVSEPLEWQDDDGEGFVTSLNGVKVTFGCLPSRTGSRSYLSFEAALNTIKIVEPHNSGLFRAKYASPDEEVLVKLLRELGSTIKLQCHMRAKAQREAADLLRESMYRRLLGQTVSESQVRTRIKCIFP